MRAIITRHFLSNLTEVHLGKITQLVKDLNLVTTATLFGDHSLTMSQPAAGDTGLGPRQLQFKRPRSPASEAADMPEGRRRKGKHKKKGGGRFRRVSKLGAYRKRQKSNFVRKRAPVVETKRKAFETLRDVSFYTGGSSMGQDQINAMISDHTEFHAHDIATVHMNPLTYLVWSQGLDQSQHIGQSVTVKYTNMKVLVRFPQADMSVTVTSQASGQEVTLPQNIPHTPQSYELIWGWVPYALNLTGQTTPAANVVSLQQIQDNINLRVQDYVNARKDRIRFIPKRESTIRIIGRKKVAPDLRHQSTIPPVSTEKTAEKSQAGTIPDWFGEINWDHGDRKLHLEQTGNLNGTVAENENVIGMYPNYQWLPFCTLVLWDYEDLQERQGADPAFGKRLECPSVKWNDITYFSDS